MQIRRMTEKDLDDIETLERQIFPNPWARSSFDFEIKHNPYSFPLILEENKEIIGYAVIWKIYEEFHIANIAIRPDYQGRKLGKYLLMEILKMADNCKYAILEVRESNVKAIQLYEKFGFKVIMKRIAYYQNGETALVMQKIFRKSAPDIK